jgi:hypothetical protein
MATALFSAGESITFATHMRIRGEIPLIVLDGSYSAYRLVIPGTPKAPTYPNAKQVKISGILS